MVLKCDYQYLFNKEKINTRIKEKHEREDFKKYMILSGMWKHSYYTNLKFNSIQNLDCKLIGLPYKLAD